MSAESTGRREPTDPERRLLRLLASRAPNQSMDWVERVLVEPMDDGGMGSLRLFTTSDTSVQRVFGQRVAEYQFTDADGVEVIASLNLDADGRPFEMDVWKTDFKPLLSVPDVERPIE